MKFRQKGYICHRPLRFKALVSTFDFGEDSLIYTFDNSSAKNGGTLDYHKIPLRSSSKEYSLWWSKYIWVLCATPLSLALLHDAITGDMASLKEVIFMLAGVSLFFFFLPRLVRPLTVTTFPTKPLMGLLHDRQYEAILREIDSHRLNMLRTKMAQVDFNRPYYEELGKFRWLRQENIITEEEWHQARQKISALRERSLTPPPDPGRMN